MALTDKLTDIADAIREAGGTTAKLTPAEMPDAIEKLGENTEYPTLNMYQGQPFTLTADLAKADGTAWEMPSTDTLALHMWHGADTLDASGSTATLSVDVPADAVCKVWHWTLVLTHGGTDYMVALGDAECRAEGTAKERHVSGVVDKARKVSTAVSGRVLEPTLVKSSGAQLSNYQAHASGYLSARLASCTSIGDCAFIGCSDMLSVELPACTSMGGSIFNGCTSLTSVELPACTKVRNYTFNDCTSLTSVELPSCTSIGGNAFSGCTSLASVELPAKPSTAPQL